ncbi:heme utilization cystosolic carrier protein HutX [Aliivibrio sifiae]|uniref:HuvX protein n=1 Tax=Aliivibrio sifiae TaxID=566293 RepID=A0A2S7XIN3_9GAMM|nr:heme utilization cystosolic carrier protein HutX [Aliivibrio sifiae]PQJ93570.1 HuvX protein [Aliivibrio sifiae]GLR74332.1 HuvX protein [Aliivibrio sifiae]
MNKKVIELLEQDPSLLPSDIAKQLELSECEVVKLLPEEMVTLVEGSKAQDILEGLVGFGDVTTIIHSFGSIFEVKAPFPKGKLAHGYYNLMGRNGELHGHLRLDLITDIALVSKPFRGSESHYFGFFNQDGHSVFKIYLGRDKKRQLIPEQVSSFIALKQEYK